MKWSHLSWIILVALIGVGAYAKVMNRRVNPELHEKVKRCVARQPELQPHYDEAMNDEVLSLSEARKILKAARTLRNSEESPK